MKSENSKGEYYSDVLDDFMVVETLLEHGAPVTLVVLESIFSRFYDVELKLPLPVMRFAENERRHIALTVVREMLEALLDIDNEIVNYGVEKFEEELGDPYRLCPEKTKKLDDLWKEFAGCFAEEINSTVAELNLSESEEEDLYENYISDTANELEMSEDDFMSIVKTDTSFRLMLRRGGIDPDRLIPPN